MPKEVLRDPSGYWNVVVKWNRESADLQLGLESSDERSIVDCLYADSDELHGAKLVRLLVEQRLMESIVKHDDHSEPGFFKEVGRLSRLALNQMPGNPGGEGGYTSIWSSPNRYWTNRLVVHLRRARNAVYGKDE